MTKPFVVLDIETVPNAQALEMEPPEDYLQRGIRDNFKPATVEEYRERNREQWATDVLTIGSTDWRYCQVVCACIWDSRKPEEVLWLTDTREYRILHDVHAVLLSGANPVHGFGIGTFDLPILRKRSALGLSGLDWTPWRWNRWNPTAGNVFDWQYILSDGKGPETGWSMHRYAEWFGLEHQHPETGTQVAQWWLDGDTAAIVDHCTQHVRAEAELAQRFMPLIGGRTP